MPSLGDISSLMKCHFGTVLWSLVRVPHESLLKVSDKNLIVNTCHHLVFALIM